MGLRLAERGGKNAKKRAVVACQKVAVLLHRLWVTGEVYEPLRNSTKRCALRLKVKSSPQNRDARADGVGDRRY